MEKALIIFIKNPIKGKAKTRLAKSIGDNKAHEVYLDLLDKCRTECEPVKAEKLLYYSHFIDEKDDWSNSVFKKHLQQGVDLGERMSVAFKEVKAKRTIIIGSDCYDLSTQIIESAFDALNSNDVVIGPANDGGYYLLGTKGFYPMLFQNINWSTERVFEQTQERIKDMELSSKILQELVDLDTLEDLEQSSYKFNS